jgi:hypothetical protein
MIFLKPDGKIDLEHRAYFLRGAPHRTVVIAAAEDGQLSILSPDLKKVQLRRLPSRIRAVSPHPSDRRLAWVNGKTGSLTVEEFDASSKPDCSLVPGGMDVSAFRGPTCVPARRTTFLGDKVNGDG